MDLFEEAERYFLNVYNRIPLNIKYGKGVWLYDDKGDRYLDFIAGIAVNALGYNHPVINKAITNQLKKNLHLSNYFIQDVQLNLAQKLISLTPCCSKIFFCNSGAEANEGLLKLVKKWGNKYDKSQIVSFTGSFHGRTIGALSITGQDKYTKNFKPLLPHIKLASFNDVNSLRKVISSKTCAVFFEGISGEGGVKQISAELIQTIIELKEKYGFLVIIDEIQTGIGRTGKFYSYEHLNIIPDAISTAKALGGGLPLAAFLVSEKLADILESGEHGTTFGGNPLACAAGFASVNIISESTFLQNVVACGKYLIEGINKLKSEYPQIIVDVRGAGLMIGIEIKKVGLDIVKEARNMGILINITAGNTVLRLLPPLIIGLKHMNYFLQCLNQILSKLTNRK
jgi:predicted acetylornithine/succinylornithine family transaminase